MTRHEVRETRRIAQAHVQWQLLHQQRLNARSRSATVRQRMRGVCT
jgi:hypothetical protein